jgi:tRNA pseudouridine38-40 synthase
MSRYFIFLSYRGTAYYGWQLQPGRKTVQGVLSAALSTVLSRPTAVTGAGRTDTGVHASFFCAHFDALRDDLWDDDKLLYSLNSLLPDDIAVSRIVKVRSDASARFDAFSRTYRYAISRAKDPFAADTSWLLHWPLDLKRLNEASAILLRHSDFTSFSRLHGGNKTTICRVTKAEWHEEGGLTVFTVSADRFLRNMVRAIVGTMIPVGRGKLAPEAIEEILKGRDRGLAGQSAPAHGLTLTAIEYPAGLFS